MQNSTCLIKLRRNDIKVLGIAAIVAPKDGIRYTVSHLDKTRSP
jgi:hypothetical protein